MGKTIKNTDAKRSNPYSRRSAPGKRAPAPLPAPKPASQSQSQTQNDDRDFKYKCFIVFVDDPKLQRPFNVLQGSKIQCLETKKYVNTRYLNDDRRRRRFDVAFSDVFAFPCRVFAKSENNVKPVKLHKVCQELNNQFQVLLSCNVDVETAYEKLMASRPRKVKDGIIYETGEADADCPKSPLPDTMSSYSSEGDSQRMIDTQPLGEGEGEGDGEDEDESDKEVRTS